MAAKRTSAQTAARTDAAQAHSGSEAETSAMPAWINEAMDQGVKPDQALALIGLGLVQKMVGAGDSAWVWNEPEDGGSADLPCLRRRLELTALALQTSAPLSTAEVTYLMGARPGAALVERGGLLARRLSRNVWKLSRSSAERPGEEGDRFGNGFGEGFRRRL